MRAHDTVRLTTVRLLLSELKNRVIAQRRDLSETEELEVLAGQAKRRHESITAYEKGGRTDLAASERTELAVIEAYLPPQLTADEVRTIVQEVIDAIGARGRKDFGRVMGQLMPRLKGRFSGKEARPIVEAALGD